MHASIRIGDSMVMLIDEFPEWNVVRTERAEGHAGDDPPLRRGCRCFAARAVAAGAKVIMPVEDMFWGDRYGVVEDPFGHQWSVAHAHAGRDARGDAAGDAEDVRAADVQPIRTEDDIDRRKHSR